MATIIYPRGRGHPSSEPNGIGAPTPELLNAILLELRFQPQQDKRLRTVLKTNLKTIRKALYLLEADKKVQRSPEPGPYTWSVYVPSSTGATAPALGNYHQEKKYNEPVFDEAPEHRRDRLMQHLDTMIMSLREMKVHTSAYFKNEKVFASKRKEWERMFTKQLRDFEAMGNP